MAQIEFDRVTRSYSLPGGEKVRALVEASFVVESGSLVVMAGPSGCGKTTALRLIAGLDEPDTGDIRVDGRSMRGVPPHEREVAMVFQECALYPHLSVRENLVFSLHVRKVPRTEIQRRVSEMAERFEIAPWLERYPEELSGGQKQRVALARALVRQPAGLLLDEPLSSVDQPSRLQLRRIIQQLQAATGTTTIYVTHDQTEAMALGERIILLDQGTVRQAADPLELYQRPTDRLAARFLGAPPMNFLPATWRWEADGIVAEVGASTGGGVGTAAGKPPSTPAGSIRLETKRFKGGNSLPPQVWCGFRPEEVATVATEMPPPANGKWTLPCRVMAVENLGRESWIHAECAGQPLVVAGIAGAGLKPGQSFWLTLELQKLHWFDAATEARIER